MAAIRSRLHDTRFKEAFGTESAKGYINRCSRDLPPGAFLQFQYDLDAVRFRSSS
jgi:hypothetical protein